MDTVLADFGLSKSLRAAGGAGLTQRSTTGGEIAFLAPEQILDARAVGFQTDLYSLAASLYYALTGAWHFDAPMEGALVWKAVLEATPVALRTRRPDVPARLAETIDRALSREPAQRFRDAGHMKAVLGG